MPGARRPCVPRPADDPPRQARLTSVPRSEALDPVLARRQRCCSGPRRACPRPAAARAIGARQRRPAAPRGGPRRPRLLRLPDHPLRTRRRTPRAPRAADPVPGPPGRLRAGTGSRVWPCRPYPPTAPRRNGHTTGTCSAQPLSPTAPAPTPHTRSAAAPTPHCAACTRPARRRTGRSAGCSSPRPRCRPAAPSGRTPAG